MMVKKTFTAVLVSGSLLLGGCSHFIAGNPAPRSGYYTPEKYHHKMLGEYTNTHSPPVERRPSRASDLSRCHKQGTCKAY